MTKHDPKKCWHEIWLEFRYLKVLSWRNLCSCCQTSGRDLKPNLSYRELCWSPALAGLKGCTQVCLGHGSWVLVSIRALRSSVGLMAVLVEGGHSQPCGGSCFYSFLMLFLLLFYFLHLAEGSKGTWIQLPHLPESVNSYPLLSCAVLKPLDYQQFRLEVCPTCPYWKTWGLVVQMYERNEGKCLKGWKHGFQSSLHSNLYTLWNDFLLKFLPPSLSLQTQGVLNLYLPSQRSAVWHTRTGTSLAAAVLKGLKNGPPFLSSRESWAIGSQCKKVLSPLWMWVLEE